MRIELNNVEEVCNYWDKFAHLRESGVLIWGVRYEDLKDYLGNQYKVFNIKCENVKSKKNKKGRYGDSQQKWEIIKII